MNNMTLRDLLMQAAAMAVMAVRENRYPGPAIIADDILAETPEVMAWRERAVYCCVDRNVYGELNLIL